MSARLSQIYTKAGDKGTTQLATGTTVSKSHVRIEAFGSVDELNCFCGTLADSLVCDKTHSWADDFKCLRLIQQELFDIGGELSFPAADPFLDKLPSKIQSAHSQRLEREIDEMNAHLSPLANFVLPGGDVLCSKAHVCRSVCRRAERAVCRLAEHEEVRQEIGVYLNRLSDWFFVFSRKVIHMRGGKEVLWDQQRSSS
ncbi:MAG: cob(I)yrinic acid a,c-diamide adenosyltransferase [Proteobacteria bacterium]|nr:cob(I)yrinic acid a,c-diamide adenosyltransferase [Pseudomonadota bacterium]